MNLNDYIEYYNNVFIPSYADAVALLADKPQQLIIEQENSLSHLILYLKDNTDINNLKKAKGHLERGTLDAYKMMWVELKKKLLYYTSHDKDNIALVFNLSTQEVLEKLEKFDKNIKEARLIEARNIGKGNLEVSEKYLDSILIGMELIDAIDFNKIKSHKKKTFKEIVKQNSLGFILGVSSSILASFIIFKFDFFK